MKVWETVLAAVCLVAVSGCGVEPTPADAGALDGGAERGDAGERPDAGSSGLCPSDRWCDDGEFCTGVERCSPGHPAADARGCVPGRAPCMVPTLICDELFDMCTLECDADRDGYRSVECGGDDCDDHNAEISPSQAEICDAAGVDEDCDPATLGPDADGDGYVFWECCGLHPGEEIRCGTDCDDSSPYARPGGAEACNDRDDDCDGRIDEGYDLKRRHWWDCDRDGAGDWERPIVGCPQERPLDCPDGEPSVNDDDCDDRDPSRYPTAGETCNGIDDDCDGLVDLTRQDDDRDGFMPGCPPLGDCHDGRADVYPGAPESCDGVDQNCDGVAEDADGDRLLAPDVVCEGGPYAGYLRTDCDDSTSLAGDSEGRCDGFDNDCDGLVDETGSAPCAEWVGSRAVGVGEWGCEGRCVVLSCAAGFANCAATDTYCDTPTDWSLDHCGGCAMPCVEQGCDAGACVAWTALRPGRHDICGRLPSGGWACGDGREHYPGPITDRMGEHFLRPDGTFVPYYTFGTDAIEMDSEHTEAVCTRERSGGVRCRGRGALGDGVLDRNPHGPVEVLGMDDATGIAVGYTSGQLFACALRATGRVACWGEGERGEIGDGTLGIHLTPVEVPGLSDVTAITAGLHHVCALTGGQVWCWGALSGVATLSPVRVSALSDVDEIDAYGFVTCARSGGRMWCWGDNSVGQLGDGTTTSSATPVAVVGAADATEIHVGARAVCARHADGSWGCWGDPMLTRRTPLW